MRSPSTATTPVANPLSAAALAISARAWLAIDLAARLIGAAGALLYAWQQYDELDQYFGRTWAFAIALTVLAVATALPLSGTFAAIARSAGASALFFGGAMLASEPAGVAAMLAGAVAWLAGSAAAHHRSESQGASLAGLVIGAAFAFAAALVIALTIEG